jgi:chemotaxis receptor (MCP) glutamine deamidase CheD
MLKAAKEISVEPDTFRVARQAVLIADLCASMAVCLFDDTQGVGGLLHLRYVAVNGDTPVDLTDNTLSSDLLLMDRFCKELRSMGARKQSWRVQIIAHLPAVPAVDLPAATIVDLLRAYFADNRLPVECRELRTQDRKQLRFNPYEGSISV